MVDEWGRAPGWATALLSSEGCGYQGSEAITEGCRVPLLIQTSDSQEAMSCVKNMPTPNWVKQSQSRVMAA